VIDRRFGLILVPLLLAVALIVACAPEQAPAPSSEGETEDSAPATDEEEPVAAEAQSYTWQVQSPWASGSPSGDLFAEFAVRVEDMTDGRLELVVQPPGSVVPSLELLDGVGKGVLDACFSWPGWYAGKDPAFACLGGLPFAFNNDLELDAWFQHRGGLDMIREAYAPHNCYVVGMSYYNIESWHASREITTVDDLQGMKIRMPGGMLSDIFESVGCSVVLLPGEEVYTALEKGVVDGVDWATPADNYAYGFHEIAKYFTWPGWHHLPANEFMVNQDMWDELPADLQITLEAAIREWAFERCTTLLIEDYAAVDAMIAQGCTPVAWDEEEILKLRNIAVGVWDEWGAKSDLAGRVIDSTKDFMRLLGQIS